MAVAGEGGEWGSGGQVCLATFPVGDRGPSPQRELQAERPEAWEVLGHLGKPTELLLKQRRLGGGEQSAASQQPSCLLGGYQLGHVGSQEREHLERCGGVEGGGPAVFTVTS